MTNGTRSAALAALVIAVGGAGIWLGRESVHTTGEAATSQPTTAEESPATALVQTMSLRKGTITQTVEAYGSIQPIAGSAINISVSFEAKINRVFVTPGQAVDATTPIVEVGPTTDALLQLKQSQDALAAAQTNVELAKKRRDEQLATNTEVATAEQALRVAQTQADSLNKRGVGEVTTLIAGMSGFVTLIPAQPGQIAPAGTALASLSPAHSLEAIVGIDSTIADILKPDIAIELHDLHTGDDTPSVLGTLRTIAQQLNLQTHLRDVSVKLPESSHLMQGTFVIAHLPTKTVTGLIVPRSAVLPDDDEQVVFTVVDGKAKRHVVEIALSNSEQHLVVSEELREGNQIVFVGNAELEDGMAVKIATPAEVKDDDEKGGEK